MVFGLLYVVGALVATCAAWPSVSSSRLYLAGIMVLVPMGTAGIKANISNFGADQYDTSDPAQAAAQDKFFSWFYLSINVGSAVSYGYLTTLGSNGGMGVPQAYGYFAAYGIASCCMLAAVALFMAGHGRYRHQPMLRNSTMGCVAKHVTAAARKGSVEASCFCIGTVLLVGAIVFSVVSALIQTGKNGFVLAAFVCALLGVVAVVCTSIRPTWLIGSPADVSLRSSEVAGFLRLLPVLITSNLSFCAMYNSMQYWYQQQACQMDLRMPFTTSSQFSGSFFMIADCLGIVIATPIAVGWLNPWLESKFPRMFGHFQKFSLGMAFGGVSVLMAAYMEVMRRGMPFLDQVSNCAPEGIRMSAMRADWMVWPFLLMGIGEIYTQPVIMHFAYSKSPAATRTLAAVMSLVIGAVSNAIFTVQVAALSPFVPNDLNNGHLEYGYYLNLLLALVLFVGFAHCMDVHTKFEDNAVVAKAAEADAA